MLGGALGSGGRYLVATWMLARFGTGFPWGTLAVNAVGSLVLGAVTQFATVPGALHPDARILLTTGVLGGFTTYSTFNHETLQFVASGSLWMAAGNVVATVSTCLIAGFVGMALTRVLAAI